MIHTAPAIVDLLVLVASIVSFLIGAWASISIIGWIHGLFEMYKIPSFSRWQRFVQFLITPCLIGMNMLLAFGFLIFGLYGLYLLSAVYALDVGPSLIALAFVGIAGIIVATLAVLEQRKNSELYITPQGIDLKRYYDGPLKSKPTQVRARLQRSLVIEKNEVTRVDFIKAKPPLWEMLFDPASAKDIVIITTKSKLYYAKPVPVYDARLIEQELRKIYRG